MCAQHSTKKNSIWLSTPFLYTVMILLGVLCGMSDISILKSVGFFIADVFIRIFKCISLPIIALSIVVTLSHYRSDGLMKAIWRRTLSYTFATTFIAAMVSCLLYLMIHPSLVNEVAPTTSQLPIEHWHAYLI